MALENDILRLLKDRQSIQNALPFEITLGEEFITGGQAVVYIGEFQSQKAAIKILNELIEKLVQCKPSIVLVLREFYQIM